MAITPEQSQQVTNLQRRILANVAQGKPSADGITREELSDALNILRGDRAKSLAGGATKPGRKKPAPSASASDAADSIAAKLKAKGFNLD